jgi:hypothetical protein
MNNVARVKLMAEDLQDAALIGCPVDWLEEQSKKWSLAPIHFAGLKEQRRKQMREVHEDRYQNDPIRLAQAKRVGQIVNDAYRRMLERRKTIPWR